jgi:hypothetical protein
MAAASSGYCCEQHRAAEWRYAYRVVRAAGPEGEAFPGFCRVIRRRRVAGTSTSGDLLPALKTDLSILNLETP